MATRLTIQKGLTLSSATLLTVVGACAGPGAEQAIPGAESLTPLAPIQTVTRGAVYLENFCEDPAKDSSTLTPLEAAADMFALPATMLTWSARLAAYGTAGVVMVYSGVPAKEAVDRINGWLPWGWSGPDPDKVDYRSLPPAKSCLWPLHEDPQHEQIRYVPSGGDYPAWHKRRVE